MKIVRTAFGSLLALNFALEPGDAFSCGCPRASYEQLVDTAEYVFVAQMTTAKYVEGDGADESDRVLVEFVPIDVLKGNPGDLDFLVGGLGGGDCGFPVVVGHKILVQTDKSGRLSICDGTRVAYIGNEAWDRYLESVRNHIDKGTSIEPMEWDEYGPASHKNAEYR